MHNDLSLRAQSRSFQGSEASLDEMLKHVQHDACINVTARLYRVFMSTHSLLTR